MSEVVINVTKVEEVVTINATPNVTQILVNTNSGGGIPEAPIDGNLYGRKNATWEQVIGGGGAVDSVNGQTGVVVLDADDISDTSTTKKFVTDANLVVIGNTSGTNSGDNATNTTSNSYADAKVVAELASFKTANFLDFTSSGQTQLNLRPIVLKNNFTPNTLTSNVLTETIVDNYDLGVGFLEVGESLNFEAVITKNTSVNGSIQSFLYLSKVSNSISVTDAVKIATSSALGPGGGSVLFERVFHRRTSAVLSCRVAGTTATTTDFASLNNLAQNVVNDVNLNDYRFLIVASTYTGTVGGLTMQTNIILTKNPVV